MESHRFRSLAAVVALVLLGASAAADSWSWRRVAPAGWPAGRRFGAACWTGNEVLLWGGRVGSGDFVHDGYRTDLSGATWRKLPDAGDTGSFDWGFSAVWTGSEWILWAGRGVRYSPSRDSWKPVPEAAGAPQLGHSVVWTGTEMIVWGGSDGGNLLESGFRYDPRTDAWRRTTTTGAPSTRSFHSAVWTGSEMLVWGGYELSWHGTYFSTDYRQDMGLYDPVADAWRTARFASAPSAVFASAAWTGREFFYWGGQNDASRQLAAGGFFDVSRMTWRDTPTNGAPVGRQDAAAAWTGQELVLFGGTTANDNAGHDTGARYVPSMDRWFATTPAGPAVYGSPATTFWTGRALVVVSDALYLYEPRGPYAHDALPDDWQEFHFGAANPSGLPDPDPDGDGQDNLREFLAGTSPVDAASRLRVTASRTSPGVVAVRFAPMRADRTYRLGWAPAIEGAAWTLLDAAPAPAPGAPGEGVFADLPGDATRFYRVSIE